MSKDLIKRSDWLPPGFKASAVSLWVSDRVTWDEFESGCNSVFRLSTVANNTLPYWIGDLLNAGERLFPDRYSQMVDVTGYAVETLRNYAWLCRKVPPDNRGIVSIPSTACVATLPVDKQEEMLKRARHESLNTAELKRLVAGDPNYKRKALPEDGSTRRDRVMSAFERVWREKEHIWMAAPTAKEMSRRVWESAVDLTILAR